MPRGSTAPSDPVSPSGWPLVGGFALALTAIGLVTERFVFLAGIFLLAAVTIEWMVRAWSDRASADAEYNQSLRDQVLRPLEYPLFALLGGAVIVSGSRASCCPSRRTPRSSSSSSSARLSCSERSVSTISRERAGGFGAVLLLVLGVVVIICGVHRRRHR